MILLVERDNSNPLYCSFVNLYDVSNNTLRSVNIDDLPNVVYLKNYHKDIEFIKSYCRFKRVKKRIKFKELVIHKRIKVESTDKKKSIFYSNFTERYLDLFNETGCNNGIIGRYYPTKKIESDDEVEVLSYNNYEVIKDPYSRDTTLLSANTWGSGDKKRVYFETDRGSIYYDLKQDVFFENKNRPLDYNADLNELGLTLLRQIGKTKEELKYIDGNIDINPILRNNKGKEEEDELKV